MRKHRLWAAMNSSALEARIAFFAMTVACLSGCAVGPDYKRPDLSLPAGYSANATNDAAGAATAIPNDWWKLFNDAQLNDLVAAALANNPDLRFAIARIDEARGALRETRAALFPEVDLVGTGARQRIGASGISSSGGSSSSGSATGGSTTNGSATGGSSSGGLGSSATQASGRAFYGNFFQLDAQISYELDLWGRVRRSTESSRAALLSTTYARDVTTLTLAGTTAQAYFALRAIDAQIAVTNSTLDAVGQSLVIAKKRLDAGYASALDYAQAETLRAQIAVQLRELRRQRAIQEHQLGNLTSNLSLRIEPNGAPDALASLPVPSAPPEGLPSTLLERRPDVRSAEQSLVAANAQIGVAKAALFPTLRLTGAYGGQSFELSDLLKAPFRFWTIGLGVFEPIFAAGRYAARVDQARARTDEQVASYQKTVETAFREVSDALTNVAESSAAEDEVNTQVEAARRSLRLSRSRYQQGYSAYLDVLDATRTANSAELLLVQNRQARLNYSVDLFKALGGGWNVDDASASREVSVPVLPTVATNAPTAAPTALTPAAR